MYNNAGNNVISFDLDTRESTFIGQPSNGWAEYKVEGVLHVIDSKAMLKIATLDAQVLVTNYTLWGAGAVRKLKPFGLTWLTLQEATGSLLCVREHCVLCLKLYFVNKTLFRTADLLNQIRQKFSVKN